MQSGKSPVALVDVDVSEIHGRLLVVVIGGANPSAHGSANTLNLEIGKHLSQTIDTCLQYITDAKENATRRQVVGVVFCSSRKHSFIVGADVNLLATLNSEQEATDAAKHLQGLFNKIEALPVPTYAILNGHAVGGGLELALACSYRFGDRNHTVVGLPEVKLGLIPGSGGCVRLPKLIGLKNALPVILTGQLLNAKRAEKLGILDAMLPSCACYFDESSRSWKLHFLAGLRALLTQTRFQALRSTNSAALQLGCTPLDRSLLYWATYSQLQKKVRETWQYPAPYVALNTIFKAWKHRFDRTNEAALDIEARAFGLLASTATAKSLERVFLMDQDAKKRAKEIGADLELEYIQRVVIIGAGHMGTGIAQSLIFRSIPVLLLDVHEETLAAAQVRIKRSLRGLPNADILGALLTVSVRPLSDAILCDGDLVLECATENVEVKQSLIRAFTERCRREDGTLVHAIFATNTSSILLSSFLSGLPRTVSRHFRDRILGLHFFNPIRNVTPVVEVVTHPDVDRSSLASVCGLASKVLKKTPVFVDGTRLPGFVVNRIMGVFYELAARLVVFHGISFTELDKYCTRVLGWVTGPFRIIDMVTLRTISAVGASMRSSIGESSVLDAVVCELRSRGFEGQNVYAGSTERSAGFYTYRGSHMVGVNATAVRAAIAAAQKCDIEGVGEVGERWTVEKAGDALMCAVVNEAARVLQEDIASCAEDVDLLMVMAAGFPPFHGGPLSYADRTGTSQLCERLDQYATELDWNTIRPCRRLQSALHGVQFFGDRPVYDVASAADRSKWKSLAPYRCPGGMVDTIFSLRTVMVLFFLVGVWFAAVGYFH